MPTQEACIRFVRLNHILDTYEISLGLEYRVAHPWEMTANLSISGFVLSDDLVDPSLNLRRPFGLISGVRAVSGEQRILEVLWKRRLLA